MSLEYLIILSVIAVLSVVQSLFGMGVLVFGTPTLLLMGYDFVTTLCYLLPASFAVSLLQLVNARSNLSPVSKDLFLLCLPGIGFGLWIVKTTQITSWFHVIIGVTLLFSALIRLSAHARMLLTSLLERHSSTYHLLMGLTHGLTNLGGALLVILASGVNTEKKIIRNTIAQYYLAFSIVQMLMLAIFMGQHEILLFNSPAMLVSAVVYLLIGNRVFNLTSNAFYNVILTFFMLAYGALVLLKV